MALILVGEDDIDVTELLLILLEDAGHETVHVDNGEAVVASFALSRPDLVLLDVAMPGSLDGLEVTRRLRDLEAGGGRRVPIMMLTARALEEDRRSGLEAGADVYLVKPFEIDEMLRIVDSLLP